MTVTANRLNASTNLNQHNINDFIKFYLNEEIYLSDTHWSRFPNNVQKFRIDLIYHEVRVYFEAKTKFEKSGKNPKNRKNPEKMKKIDSICKVLYLDFFIECNLLFFSDFSSFP